jgi:hypothetical protein
MKPAMYTIELSISREADTPRYIGRILRHSSIGLSVAEEVLIDNVNALNDWVKETIDDWC